MWGALEWTAMFESVGLVHVILAIGLSAAEEIRPGNLTLLNPDPEIYEALNWRFIEPRVIATPEFKVLKALQKRILQDMQQSEIIVNYLTDRYKVR